MKRRNQRGLTLIELVVACTIMLVLSTLSLPLVRLKIRIQREADLNYDLREMRKAIDKYRTIATRASSALPSWARTAIPTTWTSWWKARPLRTIPTAPS
jgi:general secretion pathway protein G